MKYAVEMMGSGAMIYIPSFIKIHSGIQTKTKPIPWFQSAKPSISTERPPLVGEVSAHFSG
jgi:hypothetical protein